jgi:multidrug resistance protein, MATE family
MRNWENWEKKAVYPGGYAEMWRIAAPLIMSMASYTIMQFCDRIFLARYSSTAIQAALPAGILAHTLVCFFQSLCSYAGTFTAHYHGAGNGRRCIEAAAQGLWLAVGSWPFILLLILPGLWLMKLSGHSAAVLNDERPYFIILMAGGFLVPLNAALGGYFTGLGRTNINMLANFFGCSLNVLLNYLFIFGYAGVPEMGIQGAAYATLISTAACCLLQWFIFASDRAVRHFGLAAMMRLNLPLLKRILRFGTPSGLHLLMEVGSFSLFIMLTGRLGELSLAASNIGFSINNLAFAPLLGFGVAASTLVAQHKGAGDVDAAARAGWSAVKMALVYMSVIGLSFIAMPRFYYSLFNPPDAAFTTAELLEMGRLMMIIMTSWGLFDAVAIVLGDALKGAGDTHFVMIFLSLSGWLLMIPGTVLLLWMDKSIVTLWLWLAIYVVFIMIGTTWRWCSGRWRAIEVIEPEPVLPIPDEIH